MHPIETWAFVLASLALFANTAHTRIGALTAGALDNRLDRPWKRLKGLILYAFFQKRMVRDRYAGFFHLLIFWGFVVLLLRSSSLVLEGLIPSFHLTTLLGPWGLGYQAMKDFFEVLVIVGVLLASYRRIFARPARLHNSWDAWATLNFIGWLMVFDLLANGAFIALHHPAWSPWSPVSNLLAGFLAGAAPATLYLIYRVMWWGHVVLLFGFLNFLPYSKHFHVLTVLFNVYTRELAPNNNIKPMDLEAEHFGVNRIQDFTWKQMLDFYTCTECGRCTVACPTTITHKPLVPRDFGIELRDYLYATPLSEMNRKGEAPEERPLIGGTISEDAIWACTTCGYCEWACPMFISYVDKIVDLRRYLTLEESNFPQEAMVGFKGMERQGNPWNLPRADRTVWAEGLDVPTVSEKPEAEYLFWVGCAGSYDAAGQNVSRALVKLLNAAGVSFATLGTEENCTGDSARRLGNEYLFRTLAEGNIETMNGCNVRKIVTNCPHCLNTLKNEYPAFGGNYEVVHGVELVARLVAEGRLKFTREVKTGLTYHDPCYLARYNGGTKEPRSILEAIPGLKISEMEHHGEEAMCCGAGGGRMWLEERLGKRINHERLDQALATGAEGVAVACPFCNVMLNNAARETDHEAFKTRDVLELASEALGPATARAVERNVTAAGLPGKAHRGGRVL